ncbi:DUF4157 domain-containing protein (plasmid) [Rhodococcus opacus]|nr:DUF4157 domain-containing protein [Rhodococcus opacus]
MPERLRRGMGGVYGGTYDRVRIQLGHGPEPAGGSTRVAVSRGEQVWVKPEFYHPGTLMTDAILAHELAHVGQQQHVSEVGAGSQLLERDADNAAARALGASAGRRMKRRPAGGLRLQGCSMAEAPANLDALDAAGKASVIERLQQENAPGVEDAVYLVFESAAKQSEFVALQDELDMEAVLGSMSNWDATRIGSLGPVIEGEKTLTAKRGAFIYEITHDAGLALAQVFAAFVVDTTQDDQVRLLLEWLASEQRLAETIGAMPAIKDRLAARGIDVGAYRDRGWEIGDVVRGLGEGLADVLGSSEGAKAGRSSALLHKISELPGDYSHAAWDILNAGFTDTMTPGNIALGTIDYVLFGVPSGIYGIAVGTGSGIWDISQGEVDKGTRELVPALITLGTLLVGRAVSRSGGGVQPGAGGPGEPRPVGRVRFAPRAGGAITIESIIDQFPPNLRSASTLLLERFTPGDLVRVGDYARRSAPAAAFVERNGAAGIRELGNAGGDVPQATAALAALAAVTADNPEIDLGLAPLEIPGAPGPGTATTPAQAAEAHPMPTGEEMENAATAAKTPTKLITIVQNLVRNRRGKYTGPLPIFWPHLAGKALPLTAPNSANSIGKGRRLTRVKPTPARDPDVANLFRATHTVLTGQAGHHVTPLMMGGPDSVDNMAAIWISYHDRGHALLRAQHQLPPLGYSHDPIQHDNDTRYVVVLII